MPQTAKKKKRPSPAANHADVLDLAGAAKFLRLPAKTVERLVTEQGLPGRKIGKHWRFLRAALERWLEPGATPAKSVLDQAGMFASDPDFAEFQRMIEEHRQRRTEEAA